MKNHSTIECDCGVRNYLDPYSFWDYVGNVSCAGCDKVYYIEKDHGQMVVGPEPARDGFEVRPPGFAETIEEMEHITEPPGVAPPVWSRAGFDGTCRQLTTNIRGNLQAGKPLRSEELAGSIWQEISKANNPGGTMT